MLERCEKDVKRILLAEETEEGVRTKEIPGAEL